MQSFIFYAFCGLTTIPALMILLTRNVLYAALLLLLSFLGVAGIYVFAGASFLGVAQIMVYIGGIIVILVFGIMFTMRDQEGRVLSGSRNWLLGVAGGGGMLALLLWVFSHVQLPAPTRQADADMAISFSNVEQVGIAMMSEYIIAFEFAGIILLVSLIAAAFIASKK